MQQVCGGNNILPFQSTSVDSKDMDLFFATAPAQTSWPSTMRYAHAPNRASHMGNHRMQMGRVMKTHSVNSSPNKLGGCKSVTSQASFRGRQQCREQPRPTPNQSDIIPDQYRRSRPVSWHPTSASLSQQQQASMEEMVYEFPMSGNYMYPTSGYDTYNISPPLESSQMQQYNEMSEDLERQQPLMSMYYQESFSDTQPSGWSNQSSIAPDYYMGGISAPNSGVYSSSEVRPSLEYPSSYLMQPSSPSTSSSPETPDLLPIQCLPNDSTSDLTSDLSKSKGDELIGMGLYDPPEPLPVQPSSFFHLNGSPYTLDHSVMQIMSAGKGLKLEETWAPPEKEAQNEDDSEDEDEKPVVTPPPVEPVSKPVFSRADITNKNYYFDGESEMNENCYPMQPMSATQMGFNIGHSNSVPWLTS
ncbi:MAG: hypothetical protein M1834_009375 [Cirrosporium novae-zelandiae]|nr:MAG: hypothetical protein M1834_009375 [Cirrosporium novae-zelandiae]